MKPRIRLIEGIKDHIVASCPVPPNQVRLAIQRWEEGHKARTPVEHGVFSVCDQVAKDLDRFAKGAGPDEPKEGA